jgi:two-component system, cell cycle response regulator
MSDEHDDDEFDRQPTMDVGGIVQTMETTIVQAKTPTFDAGEQSAYLVVLAGDRVGEMVKVGPGLIIGRGNASSFQVSDQGVSRMHLRVTPNPEGGIMAVDLGSRNGTYINGQRLNGSMALGDGDKIHIGSTAILKFSYADNLDESFQRDMYKAALKDPLTRLYNRRYLMSQLESEFSYMQRHNTPLSVVLMDIDFFKKVNDNFGHLVGDECLAGFATLLQSAIRGEDLAARYGGEEFVVVCRGIDRNGAALVAERVRERCEEKHFSKEEPELKVTISAGVASVPNPEIVDYQGLLAAADKALYEAKDGGRNRVVLSS